MDDGKSISSYRKVPGMFRPSLGTFRLFSGNVYLLWDGSTRRTTKRLAPGAKPQADAQCNDEKPEKDSHFVKPSNPPDSDCPFHRIHDIHKEIIPGRSQPKERLAGIANEGA